MCIVRIEARESVKGPGVRGLLGGKLDANDGVSGVDRAADDVLGSTGWSGKLRATSFEKTWRWKMEYGIR